MMSLSTTKELLGGDVNGAVVRADFLSITNGPLGIKRRKYFKLFESSAQGKARLEIYPNKEASVSKLPETVILASDMASITWNDSKEPKIAIVSKDVMLEVQSPSFESSQMWLKALREVLIVPSTQQLPSPLATRNSENIFDDLVEVQLTGELRKLYGKGQFYLKIESMKVFLLSFNKKPTVSWSLKIIRKFGSGNNNFHFDTGRQDPDGPNHYLFRSNKVGVKSLVDKFNAAQEAYMNQLRYSDRSVSMCSSRAEGWQFPDTHGIIQPKDEQEDFYDHDDEIYEDLYEDAASLTRVTSMRNSHTITKEKAFSVKPSDIANIQLNPITQIKPEMTDETENNESAQSSRCTTSLDQVVTDDSLIRNPGIVDGSLYTEIPRNRPKTQNVPTVINTKLNKDVSTEDINDE